MLSSHNMATNSAAGGTNSSTSPEITKSSSGHESTATSAAAARPSIAKQWQTERPRPTTKASILEGPGLKRNATNTSKLNEAIWNSLDNGDEESTSSSSGDDGDDDTEMRRNQRGRARRSRGSYSRFNVGNDDFNTKGRVSRSDGRLNISVKETNNRGYLAKALGATFLKHIGPSSTDDMTGMTPSTSLEGKSKDSRASSEATLTSDIPRPKLNIVVMVIGSRGDIQPFLKLGKNLKEYGHRVRIATHPAFKDFVQKDSGLEFFSVGGDPAELMAFMVKNPGMIPTMETLKKGEVGRRRDQMAEMFEGFWRACINATDDEKDVSNMKMMGEKAPFIADAIIANPPSFAHVHIAERLG
jgi:Glycosyltransferase family 28 N-terminal domain